MYPLGIESGVPWEILLCSLGAPRGASRGAREASGVALLTILHNSSVSRADDRGAKLLSTPLGDLDFQEEVLQSRLATVEKLLQDLHLLEDPHVEYALLRSCYSFPKLAYTLRTVDTSQHKAFLDRFDAAVRWARPWCRPSGTRPPSPSAGEGSACGGRRGTGRPPT
jgi:hypothetical protein